MGKLLEILLTGEWLGAITAIVLTIALTALYERFTHAETMQRVRSDQRGETKRFLSLKATGLGMFGVMPFVLYLLLLQKDVAGWIGVWPETQAWLWIIACIPLAVTAGALGSKQEHVREHYPQMRLEHWKFSHVSVSFTGWLIYLAGYEFLFRGVLLQLCIPVMGTAVAIIVNITLYALAHLGKSPREAMWSIPFGVVLCLLTIHTGSLLAPLLVHFSLSFSTELFSIRYNPEMKFVRNGR